ncbi:MAG: cytochrome c family protein [Xanthobacteraceae bacterium]|nr:cytochrome c family protein [Xanthobacteraceae bacterium]
MKSLVLAALAFGATVGMANAAKAQDLAAGEQSFRKCGPCHSVGADARNKIGPVLNGLDGRKSGTVAEYSYSEANKKADITWSDATFKDYIQNPMAKVPGTKMAFAGIKNETEIANLWAYLKQFKADGAK